MSIPLWLGCALSGSALAQHPQENNYKPPPEDKPTSGWAALPIATYSPETELGIGAFGSYFYRLGNASAQTRPSSVSADALYTMRNQTIVELIPELYWDDERWNAWARLDYRRYPNRTWAIGPRAPDKSEERHTEDRWRFQGRVGRALAEDLWLYGHLEALDMEFESVPEDTMLARGELPGAPGGRTVGVGPGIAWDSRDHLLVPRHGSFLEVVMMTWQHELASEYRFTSLLINLRKFFPVFDTHALALQLYGQLQAGHVPFYKLAQLGGQGLLRGYFEGRFRDKTLLALQAEYRFPLFWRLGAVVHAAAGKVGPSPADLQLDKPEWSVGAGLRIMLSRDEQLNLRVDGGFGRDTFGIYVSAAEAF